MIDLSDVWRELHPNEKQFTWTTPETKIQCRLDYWLVFKGVAKSVNKAEIIVFPHSDHHAIILEINDHNQRPRGPGYWVFSATLLEDKNYVDEVTNKIPQFIDYHRGIEDKGLFWEMIKMEMRAMSIAYSKRKGKTLRDYENELTNKAQALLRDYNETNSQQTIDQQNKIIKLEHISFTRANGSCIRSKARWCEFGERSTKYFLNLRLVFTSDGIGVGVVVGVVRVLPTQ